MKVERMKIEPIKALKEYTENPFWTSFRPSCERSAKSSLPTTSGPS